MSRKLCKTHTNPSFVEALLASRLVALDKYPGVRTIGIGEVMRRIIGKTVCRKFKNGMELSYGHLQLAAGDMSSFDVAIHSMRNFFNDSDSDGVLLVDAEIAFNLLIRRVALHNIQYSCPLVLKFAHNLYRHANRLFIFAEELSCEEGTTMASPLLCLSTLLF